jgi:hypothetical protein
VRRAFKAALTEFLTSTQDMSQELLNAHAVQVFCSHEDASVFFSSEEFSLDDPTVFRDLNANWWEESASFDKLFPLHSFASEIIAAHDPRAALFGPACRIEVAGLKANGTITETTKARMRRGATIFRGRFDMHLKNLESGNPTTKARMVAQSAHDTEKRFLITHAPTVHRS